MFIFLIPLPYAQKRSALNEEVEKLTAKLSNSITKELPDNKKINIAIFELENLSELVKKEDLGRIVSDLLITNFVQLRTFTIVERTRIDEVMKELNLAKTGIIDVHSANKIGKILAANFIICGSVSEVGEFFDITVRVIDVEKSTIICGEIVEIKQSDFYGSLADEKIPGKVRKKIQNNLDALYVAIHYYSAKHRKGFNVIFPKKLKDLVPEFLYEIPEPVKGRWIYDNKKGTIYNSAYPNIKPYVIYPNLQPVLDMAKKNTLLAKMRNIRVAIQMYYAEYCKFPESLDTLAQKGYFHEKKIPDALDGKWIYDPETGKISHSLLPSN
jgi:TolB-like protein